MSLRRITKALRTFLWFSSYLKPYIHIYGAKINEKKLSLASLVFLLLNKKHRTGTGLQLFMAIIVYLTFFILMTQIY